MYQSPPVTLSALAAFFRPVWVRVSATIGTALAGIASWDAASNQFDLPKIPSLFTTVAGLLPLWGWLMTFQSVIFIAALDAIKRRRTDPPIGSLDQNIAPDPRIDEIIEKQKAIIDDYQRMCALEARFDDKLSELEAAQNDDRDSDARLTALAGEVHKLINMGEKLEMVRVDGSINSRDIEKLHHTVEKNANRVSQSFGALQVRETLHSIEAEMLSVANNLYLRLKDGKTYDQDEWRDWVGMQTYWEANLKQWISFARWYAPNVENSIMTIKEDEYGGTWTIQDAQIPTAEGTRQFRRFRILLSHWETVRSIVKDGLNQVAFVGLSERDVQSRPSTIA